MSSLFSNRPSNNSGNLYNTGSSPGIIQEILLALAIVVIVYLTFMFIEVIYKYMNRLSMNRKELLPYTYVMDNKSITILQNPNIANSKPASLSENERTGAEFSYSFYLQINPSTFRQEAGLLHIFHKGYPSQFPLLAPGVYLHSNTNTLRVYINTFKTWNNYIDVQNIPVNKWVHVVIACKDNALEIYINGNISKKLSFDGIAVYQNFQDICCFSQRNIGGSLTKVKTPSLDDTGFRVFGAVKGLCSKLIYFNYALCYAEIQQLMNEGPSSKIDSDSLSNVPPYLADTWWSNGY